MSNDSSGETLQIPFSEPQDVSQNASQDSGSSQAEDSQAEDSQADNSQAEDSQMEGHSQVPVASIADADPADEDALGEQLTTLKDAARIIYPSVGEKPYLWWEQMNKTYFGRQMTPCGIQLGLTPHGRSPGAWREREGVIVLHRSLIGPDVNPWAGSEKLGERCARDVLLHQMVHQYISEVRQTSGREARLNSPQGGNGVDGGSPHNCPSWVAEINRLMEEMGLGSRACVIKQRRIDGDVQWAPPEGFPPSGYDGLTEIGELAKWPCSARPSGYYTGDGNLREGKSSVG